MYKYGYTLSASLELTFPQLKILEDNLIKILKAENGSEEKNVPTDKQQSNTSAMESTLKYLKEKTGHDQFTLDELYNVKKTIQKYNPTDK